MSNYNTLKQDINDNIFENQTQQITGLALNSILNEMVNSLGAGYQFAGVALPATNPGTPDHNVFYLAGAGTYPNFGNVTVNRGEIRAFKYNGAWDTEGGLPVGNPNGWVAGAGANSAHIGYNNVVSAPNGVASGSQNTIASDADNSSARGEDNNITGVNCDASGVNNNVSGYGASARGGVNVAGGNYSSVEGTNNTAANDSEHAEGFWNKSNTGASAAEKTLHSIGCGNSETRRNAVEVMQDGSAFFKGVGGYNGTNPSVGTNDLQTVIGGLATNNALSDMLNAMKAAGLFANYTMTWDAEAGKYTFTFSAN